MKYQPSQNYKSDDVVMTPPELAKALVNHFSLRGKGLEPCKGTGNIYNLLQNADYCEISEGKDFFDYNQHVDYIFTNPPWSKIRDFLLHSYNLTDNIYILFTVNHLWTKARLRDMKENNFGIKEICLVDTPKSFPQSGFQLAMIHLQRNWQGTIILSSISY